MTDIADLLEEANGWEVEGDQYATGLIRRLVNALYSRDEAAREYKWMWNQATDEAEAEIERLEAEIEKLRPSEDDFEYTEGDARGRPFSSVMEASAYYGPTVRLRRRKAGPWEPVPESEESK